MKITDLPDYPSIRQIQEALWQVGEVRGAAVMVGAGFSRFADRASESSPLPPLWEDFRRAMASSLGYPENIQADPLKLAQEVEVALGANALDGLIRSLVRDVEWTPTRFHERLLGLPWSDVLTTNWDTLLERTEVDPDGPAYQVVRTISDISRTRAPRIVKLHGSLPSYKPFIFTEEQFRTYPQGFAPFVNLAQQVLLENELCLVGFSGDDPNFIKWAGWVRDQLGTAARKVRLVGVLNLSPSRRQMLEHQNISVIDLAPMVESLSPGERHSAALEQFLDCLWQAKPTPAHIWNRPTRERVEASGPTKDQVATLTSSWAEARQSYPGWIVAPPRQRERIRIETDGDLRTFYSAISEASEVGQLQQLVGELLWRHQVSFWPLGRQLERIATECFAVPLAVGVSVPLSVQAFAFLTSEARQRRDWPAFDQWSAKLEALGSADALAETAYQRALRARDQLDFEALLEHVEKIDGKDPIWKVRKANILIEAGQPLAAARLVGECHRLLQSRRRSDPRSLWLLSRQAWVDWLWSAARWELQIAGVGDAPADRVWPARYRENEADPWDHFEALDKKIASERETNRKDDADSRRTKFDAGVYLSNPPGTRWTSHTVVPAVDEVRRLVDWLGLPRSLGHFDIAAGRLTKALDADRRTDPPTLWLSLRNVDSARDGLINEKFGRVDVSRLPLDLVREMTAALQRAIGFAAPRLVGNGVDGSPPFSAKWLDRSVRWTELLSRLVVRLDPAEAKSVWDFAVGLAHSPGWSHWWLYEPLGNLLKRALETLGPNERRELTADIIRLPLPGEKGGGMEVDWPELIERLPEKEAKRDFSDAFFTNRIASLIHHVGTSERIDRSRAAWRLLVLHRADALTEAERAGFAQALWGRREDDGTGLPADLDLYPHVPLLAPEPQPGLADQVFRATVIARLLNGNLSENDLTALRGAASESGNSGLLGQADAKKILDLVLSYQPRPPSRDAFLEGVRRADGVEGVLGPCLADAVLPALSSSELSEDQKELLLDRLGDARRPTFLITVAETARLIPETSQRGIAAVRRGLASADERAVFAATNAVFRLKSANASASTPFPTELAADVSASCEMRREPGLLGMLTAANALVKEGMLSNADESRLLNSLSFLWEETSYEDWNTQDFRTPQLGMVRREAVRMAENLKHRGHQDAILQTWLSQAAMDPVPEVRFALTDDEVD